ncbi:hypothetical protein PG988_006023 [Apiospora saccharicola]
MNRGALNATENALMAPRSALYMRAPQPARVSPLANSPREQNGHSYLTNQQASKRIYMSTRIQYDNHHVLLLQSKATPSQAQEGVGDPYLPATMNNWTLSVIVVLSVAMASVAVRALFLTYARWYKPRREARQQQARQRRLESARQTEDSRLRQQQLLRQQQEQQQKQTQQQQRPQPVELPPRSNVCGRDLVIDVCVRLYRVLVAAASLTHIKLEQQATQLVRRTGSDTGYQLG